MKNLAANKIIVILGPNGSGKSEFAVEIAKKWGGEIISADSRQVYKGLNIGSGKVEGEWKKISNPPTGQTGFQFPTSKESLRDLTGQISKKILNSKFQIQNKLKSQNSKVFIYKGIPHYCIDFVSPKKVFSAAEFKKCAEKAIKEIWSRGKIPIICGGTGFYIDAALGNLKIPEIPPDFKLREKLEKKSAEWLFKKLQKLNPKRAKNIDKQNKRRLMRAIEIIKYEKYKYGSEKNASTLFGRATSKLNVLYIGIKHPREILKQRIEKRLKDRLRLGMIKEVRDLHFKQKLSWKRLDDLGLEYRYISYFLREKMSKKELFEKIKTEDWRYAKRQMTWFKKNKKINWIDLSEKSRKKTEKLIKDFLEKTP